MLIIKAFFLSGYQDSNLGPPAPKAGALTGLRYTPNFSSNKGSVFFFVRKIEGHVQTVL